uniref:Uncharacterized protein n=1 Tax=Salix viminalis TaxID=40686 RepID=A0A6N2KMR9_SALVM
MGITVLVYVIEKKGWALCFGLPTGPMVVSIIILAAGIPFLSFQKPMGSLFTPFSAPSSSSPSTKKSFHLLGQLEFFYDEATGGTRSNNSAVFLSEIGIGIWLSTATVKIIESPAGGEDKGWLRNNLNKSRLDYFYRELTGRGGAAGTARDEGVVDMGDDPGASMKKRGGLR